MAYLAAKLVLLMAASCHFVLSSPAAMQQLQPASANDTASCLTHEQDALLAFKHGITNDSSNLLASWRRDQQADCCGWTGVTCSNQTGHVVELDLNSFLLDGQISPSLLSLSYLEHLDLGTNFLQGPNASAFPEFLCSMKNLRYLDLSYIPFSGRVPPLLSNLSNLEYLDLSFTSFSGRIPHQLGNLNKLRHLDLSWLYNSTYSTDVSWLSQLHMLEYVDMSNITLSTVTDFPVVANMIPTLKHIILMNCSLPCANQSIANLNLTKLEELDLRWNNFSHQIASCWFWNIPSIKSLSLDETYLYGPFPDALGRMFSLQHLDFSNNGNAATMTVDLTNLCQLESLYLAKSLSSGNITEFLEKLPKCSSRKFYTLSLPSNNMTGMLPDAIEGMTSLNDLILTNNSISGSIPLGIRNCTSMEYLHLSSNQFSGQIPSLPRSLRVFDVSRNLFSGNLPLEFGAPDLERLILSFNHITGQVPGSICKSPNMKFLDLSHNLFNGELPHCSDMPNLSFLLVSNNSFCGKFPAWLQRFSSLVFLDLSWNRFIGPLPSWIGKLVSLRILLLSHNMFDGDIPVNITDLKGLQYLNLANNNMSGPIPKSLSNLIGMTIKQRSGTNDDSESDTSLAFDESQDTFSIVTKHEVLKYGAHGLVDVAGIDLSVNHLAGAIPDELASLSLLTNINLSSNRLTGEIPKNIGSMQSLESLDISRNKLSGEIPPSLSDLTYLSYLDLSYNNLTGTIPSGRQLDTLYTENPSMYYGNGGLCGPPLKRNCSGNDTPEHGIGKNLQQESEKDSDSAFFYYGLGSGFEMVLLVMFCVLLFKKAWRISYFSLVDLVYDEGYVFLAVTWSRLARRNTSRNRN